MTPSLAQRPSTEEVRWYMFEEYIALIHTFPLISIRDDAHLAEAINVIDGLLEQPQRSTAEELYLGALTDLVETYEHAQVVIPPTGGVDVLRYLMAENGLTQADLVPLFGIPSVVSEVLSDKRRLALDHINRLSVHFGLPADVFIGSPSA